MHTLGLRRRSGAPGGGPVRGLLVGLCFVGLSALAAPAVAADAAATLDRERTRAGVWVGPSVINGLLQLRTDGTNADTAVTFLPAVALGAELWPDPAIGIALGAEIGTGAAIRMPPDFGGVDVDYNLYRFEAGARYRWYFGPRSGAPSVMLRAGLRGRWQTARELAPASLLIDRVIAGPEAGLGFAWPIVSDRVWIRLSGRAGMPFFVREPDTDSGQVAGGLAYGAHVDIAIRVVGGWYAQLAGDFQDESLEFTGDGTRTAGVTGARTHDRFIAGGLYLRYAL